MKTIKRIDMTTEHNNEDHHNYICHSGGCPGADMAWETQGYKYDVHTI